MGEYLSDEELKAIEAELEDLTPAEDEISHDRSPPSEPVKSIVDGIPSKRPESEIKRQSATQLSTFIDPSLLKKDLSFSDLNLSEAFMTQAPLYADYARRAAEASYQEDKYKQARDILEAKIDKEIREDASAAGEKITEAMIAKRIQLDPRYQKAQSRRNEAKMIAELCKSACEAFKQRRDLLIQAGADSREQFKGELRMKEIVASENISRNKLDTLKEAALRR